VLYRGPAIIIEAVNPTEPVKFGKSLDVDAVAELERLRLDGHKIRATDRKRTIEPTLESCRTTQLYRTLLHELGHWVDFLEKVERPAAADPKAYEGLLERFHRRPYCEKEHFAHYYAEGLSKSLLRTHAIPFNRQIDRERLLNDNLRLDDFAPRGLLT
jgi:hypothetical protein